MLPPESSLVDARELAVAVVERSRADAALGEVDRPAVQTGDVLVAPPRVAGGRRIHEEQLLVARDVERHDAVLGVRVHRVEDVAGVDVEPADVGIAAVPRHDTELGPALGLP
jgi:hypothetical protein